MEEKIINTLLNEGMTVRQTRRTLEKAIQLFDERTKSFLYNLPAKEACGEIRDQEDGKNDLQGQMIEEIRAAYNMALDDDTFVNRVEAAENYADNAALGCIMRKYGVRSTIDITAEMRREASELRVAAIGGDNNFDHNKYETLNQEK